MGVTRVLWIWTIFVLMSILLPDIDCIYPHRNRVKPSKKPVSVKAVTHPLDPLTETEIRQTAAIIKNYRPADWVFNYITLQEPEKSVLLPYFLSDKPPPTQEIPRRAFAVVYEQLKHELIEVTVNLDKGLVETWENAPADVDPLWTDYEALAAVDIILTNETVIDKCRQAGWPNMSLVVADIWATGYVKDMEQYRGKRLLQGFIYGKMFDKDNEFAHPFDFFPVVDLVAGKVIAIEDLPTHDNFDANNKDGNVVPTKPINYDPDLYDSTFFRDDLKPVQVAQPDGTSFTLDGNELTWQKFKMRLGFNGREGLVIYNLNYNDSGTIRPLFYRMSTSEMFIPYGDPRPPYHRKHAFDEGQYGLGICANELIAQEDCIGELVLLDGIINTGDGEPLVMPHVVCVSENDAGVLWKHTDSDYKPSITRSQRLTLMFAITVGNYDYYLTWHFYQDATIEYETKLTGIISTNLLAVNATPGPWGSVAGEGLNAQYHQHFFSVRLDPEIDGTGNTVAISDVVPSPDPTGSPQNPYGQGFTTNVTELYTASSARSNVSPVDSRTWLIRNPNKLSPVTKKPVGWKLMSHPTPPVMMRKDSPIHPQAEWMDYHTWVTPYKEGQMFSGGMHLNNSGLPEWVREDPDANVNNTDVVLWHNIGLSHVPRTEDFPVMPTETIKFVLKPYNFFTVNPALDVPPPKSERRSQKVEL